MSAEDEFGYIRRRLAPLAAGFEGAFNLTDDAAVLAPPPGRQLVVTADALVSGTHFLPDDPPGDVAHKALHVNLSDLAAMGAEPFAAMTSIVWPKAGGAALREAFADGLAASLGEAGVPLIGGDTTATDGPWTLAFTLFGTVPEGRAVRRAGACPGDLLCVTGGIGDAGLGLAALRGAVFPDDDRDYLIGRYRRPQARTALAPALRDFAHACIDISDGLLADAEKLAAASGVRTVVDVAEIPLSPAAERWLAAQADEMQARLRLAAMGDDYELLIALPEAAYPALSAAARAATIPLTVIGRVDVGEGLMARDGHGESLPIERSGFTHF
ncbi:MAG: thiamine-phosphate kinase [Maricaulaceae bacterium]|nr:thiamine-phosphate kinase [Maricaulaceae bacterium]